MFPDHSDISSYDILQKRKYPGCKVLWGALNRLQWLFHVLMLQRLWSWFALISRLSDIYLLMMSSYPLEFVGSWHHVAMVVVLVCPHFPFLRNIRCSSTSWCPHIPVFTTTFYIYYCCTDSRSIFFPVENGGSTWNFWKLAIGERGQLEVKDEK